jgi:hypothetical protein
LVGTSTEYDTAKGVLGTTKFAASYVDSDVTVTSSMYGYASMLAHSQH